MPLDVFYAVSDRNMAVDGSLLICAERSGAHFLHRVLQKSDLGHFGIYDQIGGARVVYGVPAEQVSQTRLNLNYLTAENIEHINLHVSVLDLYRYWNGRKVADRKKGNRGISDYLVMPVLTFFVSKTGDEWRRWEFSPFLGLKFEFGRMIGTFVDFLLMSFLLYLFYVKLASRLVRPEVSKKKECPFCHESIRLEAARCPFCTGDLSVKTRRPRGKNKRAENRRGQ